jgi:hypothetical protein
LTEALAKAAGASPGSQNKAAVRAVALPGSFAKKAITAQFQLHKSSSFYSEWRAIFPPFGMKLRTLRIPVED